MLTMLVMFAAAPIAVRVTLPALATVWSLVESKSAIVPELVSVMSPEVPVKRPRSSAVAPPMVRSPTLLRIDPAGDALALELQTWVSIGLPPVPIPVPASSSSWLATMSLPASPPDSVIV